MLFGRHVVRTMTGCGTSFADGFLDGYHSIFPDREPARVPFRKIPIGSIPYNCGFSTGREHALMDSDTDTDVDEDW